MPFEGTEAEVRLYEADLRRRARKDPIKINSRFEEISPDFICWYKLERLPRTVERALLSLSHLSKHFGRLPLTAITDSTIHQYKEKRIEAGLKPITVNKELNILSMVLKWAADNNLCEAPQKIKLFPGKMTRSPVPIVPTAEEIEALIQQLNRSVKGIAMLQFYAGLRRNEAQHLKAEDVLLDRNLIIITGKGGKQRVVPVVHPTLVEELKNKLKKVKSGYLWLSPYTDRPYTNIQSSLKAAAKRAGLNMRIYNHLLRHGFGTTCVESGIDLRTVQGLMGHSTSRTTEIYTHLAADHLKRQMEKFNTALNKKPDEPAPDKEPEPTV